MPSLSTAQRCYRAFSVRGGRVRTKYANCGNRVQKVTKEMEIFLVGRLRQLRTKMVCTSSTLQHEAARKKGIKLSVSWVRKVLAKKGYRWLPNYERL